MSDNKGRIQVSDKKLIMGESDVNQLLPLKYPWGLDAFDQGNQNQWTPNEVPMTEDAAMWNLAPEKGGLTDDEKLMVKRNLGFFATAETTIANNVVLALMKHITAAEVRQFLFRQGLEEAIHAVVFMHIVRSLSLDQGEIFNMYREIPNIEAKDAFIVEHTKDLTDPNFVLDSEDSIRRFLKNLIAQYLCMEGLFFYSGFVMILSLARRNKMKGIGEQYALILRDEGVHVAFGRDLIQAIRDEHPGVWNKEFEAQVYSMFEEAVGLELDYAKGCLPNGIMGLNVGLFDDYVKHIADRRLGMLNLEPVYNTPNPFEWCSESMDLPKEKNFFETTVTEYQNSLQGWD